METTVKQPNNSKRKPNWILRIGVTTAILAVSAAAGAAHHGNKGHHGGAKGPISIAAAEQRLNEAFDVADVDNSGELSAAELATVKPNKHRRGHRQHRGMGHNKAGEGRKDRRDERAGALFNALDTDNSGELSAEEFAPDRQRQARRELHRAHRFNKLDADSSNSISRDEFAVRLQRLQSADADLDGQVTRQELKAARAEHRAQRRATRESGQDS